MSLAQGLPVVLGIPEETGVSLMRDDVVDHYGRGHSPFPLAHDTEGVRGEVGLASLLPSGVVATLSG